MPVRFGAIQHVPEDMGKLMRGRPVWIPVLARAVTMGPMDFVIPCQRGEMAAPDLDLEKPAGNGFAKFVRKLARGIAEALPHRGPRRPFATVAGNLYGPTSMRPPLFD